MNRIQHLRELKNKIVSPAKKLSKTEMAICEKFIQDNEHLPDHEFAKKLNMWMVDDKDRPKRHSDMWASVLEADTTYKNNRSSR